MINLILVHNQIMGFIQRTKKEIGMLKIYISRAANYISLLNSGALLFLMLSKLKEIGYIQWDIGSYYIQILLLGFVLFAVVGYLEVRVFKGMAKEQLLSHQINPGMQSIEKKLDEIIKRIDKMENKK